MSALEPLVFETMSETERRYLLRKVLMVPPLWAFSVAAALLGIDAAVAVCRTRVLPSTLLDKLAEGTWTVDNLPSEEEAVALTWVPRVYRAMNPLYPKDEKGNRTAAGRPPVPPLKVLAGTLGLTLEQLHAVRRTIDKFHPVPGL